MSDFSFSGKDTKESYKESDKESYSETFTHKPGFYPVFCNNASITNSNRGNKMFVAEMEVDIGTNKPLIVKDYFAFTPSQKFKFKSFWEATNQKQLPENQEITPDFDMFAQAACYVQTALKEWKGKLYCAIIDYIPRFAAPYTGAYKGEDAKLYLDKEGKLKPSAPAFKIDWGKAPMEAYAEDDIPF